MMFLSNHITYLTNSSSFTTTLKTNNHYNCRILRHFKWSSISEEYLAWTPQKYREQLKHPKAVRQFSNDIEAMEACDVCVMVLPCGRSAHTEAGWFAGKGKTTIAYIPENQEPELMYKLFSVVCCSMDELIEFLNK